MALFYIRKLFFYAYNIILYFVLLQHVGHKCMGRMYVTERAGSTLKSVQNNFHKLKSNT